MERDIKLILRTLQSYNMEQNNRVKNALKILIVEDNRTTARDLEEELLEMGYSITDSVANSDAALLAFRKRIPDLVLMDIELEGSPLDGIETAEQLNTMTKVPIIYLTAFTDMATWERAKKTDPSYYLIKPWNKTQLEVAFDFAIHNFIYKEEAETKHSLVAHEPKKEILIPHKNYFFAKASDNKYVKVTVDELLYIKGAKESSEILTTKGRFILSANLKSFFAQFPHPQLMRVHRSFIVNLSKVEALQDRHLFLESKAVPVGPSYLEAVYKALNRLRSD